MTRLGTYSTIDCPTARQDEASDFLSKEFEAIGGRVRTVSNPHDLGEYKSFEIDYPAHLEAVDTDPYEEVDEEEDALIEAKEDWHNKAEAIEQKYNEKFNEVL